MLPDHTFKCAKEMTSLLKSYGVKPAWKKLISDPDDHRFIAPTETVGKWIYLESKDGLEAVANQTQFEMMRVEYNSKCEKKISYSSNPKSTTTHLDDSGLKQLIHEHKDLLVYVWSPEMPLSSCFKDC